MQANLDARLWALRDDPAIKAKIMEWYLPLVKGVAAGMAKWTTRSDLFDDFAQDGVFGLEQAIRKFDPSLGVKFTTYAQPRIRGAILDGIRNRDWVPRLARLRKEASPRMDSIDDVMHGRDVGRDYAKEKSRKDFIAIADHSVEPLDDGYLRGLSRAERLILQLYYEADLSMREIGEVIGMSESRISQMHSQLMQRLRSRLTADGMRQEPVHARRQNNRTKRPPGRPRTRRLETAAA
jgi:RNA polymerase sigma factor FliA